MIRLQIPQISNSCYVPEWFKNLINEFLDHIVRMVNANHPFIPLIEKAISEGVKHIYLFAPEVGGSSALIAKKIKETSPHVEITVLNDLLSKKRLQYLIYLGEETLKDLKMQSIHEEIKLNSLLISINHAHKLSDSEFIQHISYLQGKFDRILIGEGNNKSLRQVIGMTLIVPLVILLMTPFIRPLRFSRLLLTYIWPVLPLAIVWDGLAALFRIRSPALLIKLAETLDSKKWKWSADKLPNNRGGFIIYLLGQNKP